MLHDSAAADVKTVAGTVNMDKIVAGVVSVMCVCSMELWPVEHRVSVQLSGGF